MSKMFQKLGLVLAAVIVMLGTTSYASGTCGVKGCYRSAVYGGSYCSSHTCSKTANETIYYNVDKLHTAIFHTLQIKFQYVEWTVQKKQEFRHDGAIYTVSPLHLVWDDENYYLIAFDENAKKTKHYRVDKMRNMEILKDKRSPESAGDKTDLAGFSKKTFGMFGGTDTSVRLKCRNHLAGVVIDRFGSDVWMVPQDQDHFAATVTITVSPQFFGWVTAIGEDMEIEGPEDVKAQYEQYLERLLLKYRKKDADM